MSNAATDIKIRGGVIYIFRACCEANIFIRILQDVHLLIVALRRFSFSERIVSVMILNS